MEVILLRHGKPDITPCTSLTTAQLPGWIEAYNQAGIITKPPPPQSAIELAQSCEVVMCSDLKRSIQSADSLGVSGKVISDPVFSEIGMPYPEWPPIKLPLMAWATILRLCQFSGYKKNGESLSIARRRVNTASHKLMESAATNHSVMLVGHGYMNRLIARQLFVSGWKGPKRPGYNFWEFNVYRSPDH